MNVKKITINNEEDLEPYCSEKHLENRTKILVKQNNEYLQYLIGVIVKTSATQNAVIALINFVIISSLCLSAPLVTINY